MTSPPPRPRARSPRPRLIAAILVGMALLSALATTAVLSRPNQVAVGGPQPMHLGRVDVTERPATS